MSPKRKAQIANRIPPRLEHMGRKIRITPFNKKAELQHWVAEKRAAGLKPPQIRAEYEAMKKEMMEHWEAAKKTAEEERDRKVRDPAKKFTHIRPLQHHTEIPVRSTAEFKFRPEEGRSSMRPLKTIEHQEYGPKRKAMRKNLGL